MSVLAMVTVAIIVINFFWTKVAHDEYAGDVPPAWINRVTNIPWTIANVVWWLFAAVVIYLSVHFYFSGEFVFTVAGVAVLAYSFVRRTPKAHRSHLAGAVSKLTFIPIWLMVIIGLTDSTIILFSFFFALWSFISSVMQGRFIYLTRVFSDALEDALRREEAQASA